MSESSLLDQGAGGDVRHRGDTRIAARPKGYGVMGKA
jgi:hypothetical protein